MRLLPALLLLSAVLPAADPAPAPAPATTPAPAAQPDAKPFLGLRFDESAPNFSTEAGIPVSDVVPGATGASLGIEVGDRLTTINGKVIKGIPDLSAILGGSKVGDQVSVAVTRNGSPITFTGPLLARPRPVQIGQEVANAQKTLDEVKRLAESKAREPSLAELLQQLQDIQNGLPRAVAAFKKQYPNGTFDIRLSVTITSDATAKDPIEFTNAPKDGAKPADAKPADPKPTDAKPTEPKASETKPADAKPEAK